MMEVWLQITCDGCGTTLNTETPNTTKSEFMDELKGSGWRQFPGGLHYCRVCNKNGAAKSRRTDMSGLDFIPEEHPQHEQMMEYAKIKS